MLSEIHFDKKCNKQQQETNEKVRQTNKEIDNESVLK